MTYSEEQYNALLAVCRNYKNDYDNAFERIKAQQREIEQLKDENCELTKKLEARLTCDFVKARQNYAVQNFAEKLKKRLKLGLYEWQYAQVDVKTIDDLLKEYE